MAMAMVESTDSGQTAVLVAAVPGKLLVVTRLLFTSGVTGSLRVQSDPGGAGQADLTARLFLAGNRALDLAFGREWGLASERGKALGFTTQMSSSGNYSVALWYEVAD